MAVEQTISPGSEPIQTQVPRLTWPGAALLAALTIYGPQLLMCLYTLGFVACSHCKAGVWQVAPLAPGLLFYESGRRILDLPHFSSAVGVALSIVLSLLVFAGITAWLRHARRWWLAIAIPVAVTSGFLAVALLGAIRS